MTTRHSLNNSFSPLSLGKNWVEISETYLFATISFAASSPSSSMNSSSSKKTSGPLFPRPSRFVFSTMLEIASMVSRTFAPVAPDGSNEEAVKQWPCNFWTFANFSVIATILLLKSEPGLSYFIISFVNASDFRKYRRGSILVVPGLLKDTPFSEDLCPVLFHAWSMRTSINIFKPPDSRKMSCMSFLLHKCAKATAMRNFFACFGSVVIRYCKYSRHFLFLSKVSLSSKRCNVFCTHVVEASNRRVASRKRWTDPSAMITCTLSSLSDNPYKAKAALCCKFSTYRLASTFNSESGFLTELFVSRKCNMMSSMFESRSFKRGPIPVPKQMPIWLSVFCASLPSANEAISRKPGSEFFSISTEGAMAPPWTIRVML